MRTVIIPALAVLAVVVASGDRLLAQARPADTTTLRANVERRFEVRLLREGLLLSPRDPSRRVQAIEIASGPIAIDGQPATGAELREKLSAPDADLILSLSYLSNEERRALFASPTDVLSPPSPPSPPAPLPPLERRPSRNDRRPNFNRDASRVRIGNSVTIREGEVVDGDVVAVGGSVTVDGEVHGDVVAVGGGMTLGPKAVVSNNVVVVGGQLHRDPAARVDGRVQEVAIGNLDFGNWRWSANPLMLLWGSMVGAAFALVFTLTRLAILCLLAALVVLLGRTYVERTANHVASEAVKAGAIGFLAQLLFLPVLVITIVVLVMTIIGIPLLLLLPFALLGLAVVGLVGFTGVAYRLGGYVTARFGWPSDNPYLTTISGIVLVLSPLLLARILGLAGVVMVPFTFGLGLVGLMVEYLAWTIGFGAVALARFNRRASASPASSVPAAV